MHNHFRFLYLKNASTHYINYVRKVVLDNHYRFLYIKIHIGYILKSADVRTQVSSGNLRTSRRFLRTVCRLFWQRLSSVCSHKEFSNFEPFFPIHPHTTCAHTQEHTHAYPHTPEHTNTCLWSLAHLHTSTHTRELPKHTCSCP